MNTTDITTKTTIAVHNGKATQALEAGEVYVIKVKPGEHYRIIQRSNNKEQLLDDVIAKRVGNDLVLTYADGTKFTLQGYFVECVDEGCSVTLPADDAAGYELKADDVEGLALADGTAMVYAHGNSATLLSMAQGDSAMLNAFDEQLDGYKSAFITWQPAASGFGVLGGLSALGGVVLGASAGSTDTNDADTSTEAQALSKIEAYNNGDGTTPPPLTVQDYADAGVSGVTEDNLAAVNAGVLAAADGGADTVAEIEALVTAADGALTKIEDYQYGDTPLTTQDYADAGISGVTEDNLAAVNAGVLAAADGGADTVAEIEALVNAADGALTKIEDYQNGDTPLTAQDYADAGISGVSATNLAAVNAQVLAASAGGADSVAEIEAMVTAADASLTKIEAYIIF